MKAGSAQPTQLGKYEIIEELGRGGFGVVYRALNPDLQHEVALKVIHPQLLVEPRFVEHFFREARLAARLGEAHPNIVTIHDIAQSEGRFFIVMQLLEGQPLDKSIVARTPRTLQEALPILEQVADALDFAHSEGVLHRDVKPSNIIVRADGQATLTDFGLARAYSESGISSGEQQAGTLRYMAPEQFDASLGEIGPATDVYAQGIVAYEMLAGRPPFEGNTTQIMHGHLMRDPPRLDDVPSGVQQGLDRALAKRPDERYASGGEFVAALRHAAAPAATGKPRPQVAEPEVGTEETRRKPGPGVSTAQTGTDTGAALSRLPAWAWALIGVVAVAVLWLRLGRGGVPGGVVVRPTATRTRTATPVPPSPTPTVGAQAGATKVLEPSGITLLYVPGGEFTMGSGAQDRDAEDDEKPAHLVSLDGFWIGRTEVTNEQYRRFVDAGGYDNESYWIPEGWQWRQEKGVQQPLMWADDEWSGDQQPVVGVSWYEAAAFAQWAGARLPTEAEWEYAACGGPLSRGYRYSGSNNMDEVAWWSWNSGGTTHAVAGKQANELGLYDMSGNADEWCQDWYSATYYAVSPVWKPQGSASGSDRVLRGGSCINNFERSVRCAHRKNEFPGDRYFVVGFRVAE